jgi:hypothetical protein
MSDHPRRFHRHGPSRNIAAFHFIIPVAYVYFASGSAHTRYLMTKDEARTIAATIAKLPELLLDGGLGAVL